MLKLERLSLNPILSPTENWWESTNVFNPGATIFNNKVIILYRAVGNDRISRFGLAESEDGITFKRFNNPVFEGEETELFERLGVEDPRITKIGDTYYIFYTGASVYPLNEIDQSNAPSLSQKAPWRIRTFMITTKDFKVFSDEQLELGFDTKDTALFPEKIDTKYVLLHRKYPHMYLTESDNLKTWTNHKIILDPKPNSWDNERVGAGAPPFKTEIGWIHFYHGVNQDLIYQLGILIHKVDDPAKIIYRSTEPILTPELDWEKQGYVQNVVFTGGVVEKDGRYLVYYGAADKNIGVAAIEKERLLREIKKEIGQ